MASSGINNFSFFNRKPPIEDGEELLDYLGALKQTRQDVAEGKLVYDPTKTYMTFIVGDGDNIAFMKGGRRGWMKERVESCAPTEQCAFPLAFSMSPHLPYLAPDWLRWYFFRVISILFMLESSGTTSRSTRQAPTSSSNLQVGTSTPTLA